MSDIITVAVTADPIRTGHGNKDLIVMDDRLFIHDITPELARQWIGVLETIAKEA